MNRESLMKHSQSAILFSLVAFAAGAASTSAGVFGSGSRIHAASPGAAYMSPTAAAPTRAGHVVSTSDLSDGSVEEYAGDSDNSGGQGSGYGDVYDQKGHLLWRFAVLEGGNSKWTIFKYFSRREPQQENSKSGSDSAPELGKSGSP
jgi:hypothetical protein